MHVIQRYPVMPWSLDTTIPDYGISLDACISTRFRQAITGTRPNAVYVHGGEAGILGHVVRDTAAGDIELPTVVNPLVTGPEPATGPGGQLLADAWQPPDLAAVTLPMTGAAGDMPLIGIRDILSLTDGKNDDRGICAGITIDVTPPGLPQTEGPEIVQIAVLHGRNSNPWSRLRATRPQSPLLVGSIVSVGSGTVTVQLTGGGISTAPRTGTVAQQVFERNGVVEGEAPSLTQVEISV